MLKIILSKKKKNSKYEILNYLTFDANFAFLGTALGCFGQCSFFLVFRRRPTMVADFFIQAQIPPPPPQPPP